MKHILKTSVCFFIHFLDKHLLSISGNQSYLWISCFLSFLKEINVYFYFIYLSASGFGWLGLFAAQEICRCSMQYLSCGMWDLVPWPGIKPGPPAWGAWDLSHWITKKKSLLLSPFQSHWPFGVLRTKQAPPCLKNVLYSTMGQEHS